MTGEIDTRLRPESNERRTVISHAMLSLNTCSSYYFLPSLTSLTSLFNNSYFNISKNLCRV